MAACSPAAHVAAHVTASTRVVKELAAAVERAGIPRERFAEAANLDAGLLDAPDCRMPGSAIIACFEAAFDITQDPALGIHWAEWMTASSFALMSQLVAQAQTLRQAFATLAQFGALISDELPVSLVERGDEAEVRFTGVPGVPLRLHRLICELAMLGLFRMIRDFRPSAKVLRVDFSYPAPQYRAEYTRVFEAAEQFDQPGTCLVVERALLDEPSRLHDAEIQSQLRALAERRMAELRQRVGYAVRVRELLVREKAPQRVALSAVAQQLEISLRSLHRRLADEGLSYTAIANEASAIVAKRLLAEDRQTIQEASFTMGFADVSSFHRAFKRWTGTTPTKFLDSLSSGAAARYGTSLAERGD